MATPHNMATPRNEAQLVTEYFQKYQPSIRLFLNYAIKHHSKALAVESIARLKQDMPRISMSAAFINHRSTVRLIFDEFIRVSGSYIPTRSAFSRLAKTALQITSLRQLDNTNYRIITGAAPAYFHEDATLINLIYCAPENKHGESIVNWAIESLNAQLTINTTEVTVDTTKFNDSLKFIDHMTQKEFIDKGWNDWLLGRLKQLLNVDANIIGNYYHLCASQQLKQAANMLQTMCAASGLQDAGLHHERNQEIFKAFMITVAMEHNEHNKRTYSVVVNNWILKHLTLAEKANIEFLTSTDTAEISNKQKALRAETRNLVVDKYQSQQPIKTLPSTMEITMNENDNAKCGSALARNNQKLFEMVPTVRGQSAKFLTDDELFDTAREYETRIDHAKGQKTKPKKLVAKIEQMEQELEELIKYIDSRT